MLGGRLELVRLGLMRPFEVSATLWTKMSEYELRGFYREIGPGGIRPSLALCLDHVSCGRRMKEEAETRGNR